jgi:hypothetical protein
MHLRSRNLIALMLSVIVSLSAAQAIGLTPRAVSADKTLPIRLLRAPTSTEPASAIASMEVNLETGQAAIDVRGSSRNSDYQAVFLNGTTLQLGTFSTGDAGDAHTEVTLSFGTYIGVFQLLRLDLPQFVSANTSFTIGFASTQTVETNETTNSSVTTTTETTQIQTNETETTSTTRQVLLRVEPPSLTMNKNGIARFNIHIHANGSANVLLAAKGVPPNSVAIFTQEAGLASPEFNSALIIAGSDNTPIGSYEITVISQVNGQEFDATLALEVKSSSGTTNTQTSTSNLQSAALDVSVGTDQHNYEPNATVYIKGRVTDAAGSAVRDADVSVQVDGPAGLEIEFMTGLKTDSAGVFRNSFEIPSNSTAGTYTVFASVAKAGYAGATTHTTFVVGTSSTPSVVIGDVYTTDLSGNRSVVFRAGQTILVWVVVENSGVTFSGVIWVQIRDANGTPIWIQFQITPLGTAQTMRVAFGFQVTSSMSTGVYTVNTLVSDKLISQGGTFFASANTEFAITT